jgi:hypothetical protein
MARGGWGSGYDAAELCWESQSYWGVTARRNGCDFMEGNSGASRDFGQSDPFLTKGKPLPHH